jgi:hypothetical protein
VAAATTIVDAKVFDGTKSQDWTSVRFADGLACPRPRSSPPRETWLQSLQRLQDLHTACTSSPPHLHTPGND